jgi:microcystin-dependent protein
MSSLKVKVGTIYERITRGPKGDPGADGAIVGESKIYNGIALPTGYLWEDGSAVSRTTYAALFAAITLTISGNNLGGNPNITGIASTADIRIGYPISGPGVPTGTVVAAVNPDSITLSKATTGGSTGGQYVIAPHGVGDGVTTFNLPDKRLRVPVGAGVTNKQLGATEGLAEADRNAEWSHNHKHMLSGGISSSGTGISTQGTSVNHNHAMSFSHQTAANTPTSGGAIRVTQAAHGSTDLTAQDTTHAHGVSDPGHGHGHTLSVNDTDSGDHPYVAVNYIIKT